MTRTVECVGSREEIMSDIAVVAPGMRWIAMVRNDNGNLDVTVDGPDASVAALFDLWGYADVDDDGSPCRAE